MGKTHQNKGSKRHCSSETDKIIHCLHVAIEPRQQTLNHLPGLTAQFDAVFETHHVTAHSNVVLGPLCSGQCVGIE